MAMEEIRKQTVVQERREKRDLAIYTEYNSLVAVKGQSRTEVNKYLMKKYGIESEGTIYVIRKRVEERLTAEGKA